MKNRYVILAAGIVLQGILGGVYAWSVYVPHLTADYGFSKAQCGTVFGLSIAVFTVAMIAAGRLLPRIGPKLTAGIGSLLFAGGYALAAFSGGHFGLVLLGISIFSGAGIGFGYVCPLSVGMQWFPRHKGLITGIAVAGFGGGAMVLSSVASKLLNGGMDVLAFFAWMAVVPGAILLLAALLLAQPDGVATVRHSGSDSVPALRSPAFLLCTWGIFAGTFSGLLVIGNLTPIAVGNGLSADQAARGVSAFAIGNALGRILWGGLFDRIKERAIPLSLAAFAASLALLPVVDTTVFFALISVALGFGFGANFVIYASALSRQYGTDAFARLYPICFLGYGVAGVTGPAMGGRLADATGSFDLPLYISIGLLALAALITWRGLAVFGMRRRSSWQGDGQMALRPQGARE